MPSKKTGKNRLDKYYHLAKDQGYRARSAFKLIQLAKKFDFLSKSKVCLDLCAAPGGWSQVAQRNMPSGSQIIAIDLAPIKAIHGVTCMQADITSEKCRQQLRKEMRDKADCVLHDGAPNVGSSWSKDAFGQNELTLFAMKLACEHLKPGGTFVTKVFRSADYNSLLWVFNQLFHKVEATKPTASRNVSAEIFVMCINFKAGKIDPRFFDSKWVFMENMDPLIDGDDEDGPKKKQSAALSDLFKNMPKKKRGGYEEGDDMRITPVNAFVDSKSPAELLINSHVLDFKAEGCEELDKHPSTTEDIREIGKDLKVCGKRDLASLLKWRTKILREREGAERAAQKEKDKTALAIKVQEKKVARAARKSAKEGVQQDVDDAIAQFLEGGDEGGDEDDDSEDSEEAEAKIDEELDELVEKRRKEERVDAKKTAERQKKQEWRRKLSLNVKTDAQDEPELLRASNARSIKALEDQDKYLDPNESDHEESQDDDEEEEDSDGELDRYARMEVDLAVAHELRKAHDGEKFRSSMQRKMKKKKETRRERVMAAWSGELAAFNEALDQRAYTQYLADSKVADEDDDDDDDSDDEADLKALRRQQSGALYDKVDNDAMEASIAGPGISEAARAIMDDALGAPKKRKASADGDDEDGPNSTDLVPVAEGGGEIEQVREQHRAKRWFSQDIFKNIGAASSKDIIPLDRNSSDEEGEEGTMVELDDKELPKLPLTDKEQRKLKRKKEMEKLEKLGKKPKKADNTPMEVAPLEAPKPLNMTGPQKPSDPREHAETLALGSLLIDSKKSRMDLIDASYNRWTFDGDEALPDWFTEDENKHNVPELPITKAMMDQWRAKLREINARPIRKVAEAKARKRRRLKLRLDKIRKTAMSLADAPDMSETMKARLMRKQVSSMARQMERRCTVVAIKKGGGGNRGSSEKGKVPKGAKLKVVDKRMKNDTRSQKRSLKRNGAAINAKSRKKQLKKQRKMNGGAGPKNTGGRGGRGLYGSSV